MGTTLDHGIYLPDEGERNCYDGLAGNWVALDNHLGSTDIHVTINDKQAWNGHVADTTIHVTSADKQAWNGHVADTTIHVTAEDKQAWNGKADASALTAHTGDTTIHVTAEDKAKWDTVTSKADNSDVVHKSGNETASGQKLFDDINAISSSSEIGVSKGNNSFKVLDKNNKILARLEGGTFSSGVVYSQWLVNNGTDVFNGVALYQPSASLIQLRPYSSELTVQLGASNRYFTDCYTSKVNGLEPSSLSLPSDRSARIDISSYFTNTGTGQSNSYTVPANGYIYLTLSELTNIHCFSRSSGNVTNYAQTFTKLSNSTGALYVLFPVRKNDVFVATWYTATTVSVDNAFFIPCRGNV